MTADHLKSNIDQIWFTIQQLDEKEKKKAIKYFEKLTNKNCGFIHFYSKEFILKVLKLN